MTNEFIEKYVPKKHQEAIADVYKDMDGYWITLKEGYISTSTETQTIHEYTLAETRKQLKTIEKLDREYASEEVAPGEQLTLIDFDDYVKENGKFSNELETNIALMNEDVTELIVRSSKRKGEKVTLKSKIVIIGTLGVLNGSQFGYSEQHYRNINLFLTDYLTTLYVLKDGTIEMKYNHDDDVYYTNVYVLPDNIAISRLSIDQIEEVVSGLVALKIDNEFASIYGIKKGGEVNV